MKFNKVEQPSRIFRSPANFFAFGFGSGLSPVVPGTVGTLAAVPVYLLLAGLPVWAYLGVLLLASLVGIYLCETAAKNFGVHDHPGIVWDEFVGYWITMFLAPFHWKWMLLGFVLFRIFDMWKPWPISLADKHVHGGFGIMLDDIIAGVAAWGCLQLCIVFLG